MCLHTSIVLMAIASNLHVIVTGMAFMEGIFPTQGKIGGGNNLNEVHEVVRRFARNLLRIVQWVQVVIGPRKRLRAHFCNYIIWKLRSKSQGVDLMSEDMTTLDRGIEVVV